MEVIFAGGASGVGASCTAIELAGQWFVVDAGVRVERQADPLPDLSLLEDKAVRAIFVTHAHADHIGALPLLHQAFPAVPIYASRATGLLMEVMLSDALKVMSKRAVEEMELPLYPPELVAKMLDHVRPLPVGETLTLPDLPGVTIATSRAGHIAGAICLGFSARDGSIVISGDISSTPQRTVLGAVPPAIERPDLLVLESTYGTRLHPNRQAEEQRFAQAVAEGIQRGGHTLIPCFGLGRGQELLLILQAAQEQGQIPPFPIYVDGLVRRVCSTYLLMPEALTPRLQRQIRKGYPPFSSAQIHFVHDERERLRLLSGPPACILSSSGMLTGGPSAWYAAQLAPDSQASILITGYQDEESPGKKLLDLANQESNTLELAGKTVQVQCHVAKYNLSAHADGSELAAYATALKPRQVALVHGDDDARAALQSRLSDFKVILPANGKSLSFEKGRPAKQTATAQSALAMLSTAIGNGAPFDFEAVSTVWKAVKRVPTLRVITAREMALVWYGEATEEHTQQVLDVLEDDYEQRYFVHQHALAEAFRVRGQQSEEEGDSLSDLVGSVLLMQLRFSHSKPALCVEVDPPAFVRVQLPPGTNERTRQPLSSILEILGSIPADVNESRSATAKFLDELVKSARAPRRHMSARALAQQCEEGVAYTLGELCQLLEVDERDMVMRLAVSKLVHLHPMLFMQTRSVIDGEGISLYMLASDWQEALNEPETVARPDQNRIHMIVEDYLGTPDDLARRSVDPDSGDVTLHFHYPLVAAKRYQAAIEAAAEEANVSITISPSTNQFMLSQLAQDILPPELTVWGSPSIYLDRNVIQCICSGKAPAEAVADAQQRFLETTGWTLELKYFQPGGQPVVAQVSQQKSSSPVPQHQATQIAQQLLNPLPGFYRVGLELATKTLVVRFYFPDAAQRQYGDVLERLEVATGWQVRLYPGVNQEALINCARRVLPDEVTSSEQPSLFQGQHIVRLRCSGTATEEALEQAKAQFTEETGWTLDLKFA